MWSTTGLKEWIGVAAVTGARSGFIVALLMSSLLETPVAASVLWKCLLTRRAIRRQAAM
jgi:hypothetical protein